MPNLARRRFLGHRAGFGAVLAVLMLSACSESKAHTRFDPLDVNATATTTSNVTTTLAEQPIAPWTQRTFSEPAANGATRPCVEVTVGTSTASACLGLSGVSSWTVAGQHFVFGRGDVSLSDGSIIRAGADGIAIGVLRRPALPTADASSDCNRHDIALAVVEHYPESAPAWAPTRCADDQLAAADVLLGDRSVVVALFERSRAGDWNVIATFRAPVRCSLLDTASRVKCKLLRYDD